MCGGLCGKFQWKVFEKTAEGRWEQRAWVACMTVAGHAGNAFRKMKR
jgi:hypothetical protein